jgi:hypothetical protein
MHLPNEPDDFVQEGARDAFNTLLQEGVLSDYLAYSYLKRDQEARDHQEAMEELLETARAFCPDVIFVQHLMASYPVSRDYLKKLKSISSKPKLVIHEADAFGRYVKRLDVIQKLLFSESDIVFLTGLGYLAQQVRKAGAIRVRFTTPSVDRSRFEVPWIPTRERQYDAVMIGNLINLKRIPGLYMPGGYRRKVTSQLLYEAFGERFGVFGRHGWKGFPFYQGSVSYNEQHRAIRSAWVTVGWDHFNDLPMYSSDRVPISIACGVPHITNMQPGYEHTYHSQVPGLFIVKSPREAVDLTTYLVSLSVEERIELGSRAAEYAWQNLETTVVIRRMVEVIKEQLIRHSSCPDS